MQKRITALLTTICLIIMAASLTGCGGKTSAEESSGRAAVCYVIAPTANSQGLNFNSPPPSHALKDLAVLILPSPGSRRSITSPNETASYLHSLFGFKLRFMVLYSPLLSDTVCKLYGFLCHLLYLVKLSGLYHIALYHPASATADNLVTA